MIGIAFGLGAALVWGLGDYVATLGSRRLGPFQAVLGFHVLATIGLLAPVLATGALGDVDARQVGLLAGAAVLSALFYPAFFRALEIGPLSIVSPVVSGYAAVTVILAVLLLDERLSGGQIAAVVVAFLGVACASSDFGGSSRSAAGSRGILYALFAAATGGAVLLIVGHVSAESGWLAPVFLLRAFTTCYLLAFAVRGGRWRLPVRDRRALGFVAGVAVLDTGGFVFYNLGVREAEISLVATASAPYAVVPAILGMLFLHERPKPLQLFGSALIVAALVLLGVFA